MAFTPYITFVAGNVLLAAQLNQQVRDNGNFLLNGKAVQQLYYLNGTTDYALTLPQATWTNIDSTHLKSTLANTFSSGRVRIDMDFFAIIGGTLTSVTKMIFDISIDNKAFSGSGTVNANGVATATPLTNGLFVVSYDTGYQGGSVITPVHLTAIITSGLSTGTTHTFEPMYTTAGATSTVTVLSKYHPFVSIVEEI